MAIILVSAMSSDRVIGYQDGMPWSVPAEYQNYLEMIRGQTVIMGRKSLEIFGPDLTCDRTLVVTRSKNTDHLVRFAKQLEVSGSVKEAIDMASAGPGNTFVAGGASIYEQALPLADRMHLSTIHGNFNGDTYFPAFTSDDWLVTTDEPRQGYDYREYIRRS